MTENEIILAAEAAHAQATTLVLEDRDAEARRAYEQAADLYAQAGCAQNAGYMRECAEAV